MVGFGDEHAAEALCALARRRVAQVNLKLVQPLEVESDRALRAVDLPGEGVLAAGAEPRGFDRADGAVLELDDRLEGVVDLAPLLEGSRGPAHRRDFPDEIARQVDHVRAQVAERSRAGGLAVESPDLVVDVAPLLEIAPSEVVDVAQLPGLQHLAREADRRDEAVVESAHVLDAGRRDALPDLVALVGRARQRLLADDVLAGLGRRDRRLCVQVVRPAVVEEPDLAIRKQLVPVGRVALEAVAARRLRHRLLRPPGDGDEPWQQGWRPRHVRDLPVGVRVGLPHERVAEHADPDGPKLGRAIGPAHGEEADLRLVHPQLLS